MTRDKDKKPGKEQQLLEAARLGRVDQLELLLNQFHKLKTKKRSNPLASLRKCIGPNTIRDPVTGFTCLHHAALNGHSQAVQLIVSYGGRLNAVDYKGSTALHLAAWSGNLQVVKTLMSYLEAPQTTATTTTGEQENYQSSTLFASSGAASASTSTSPLAGGRAALTEQTKQQIKSSSPNHSKHTASQQQAASPDAGDCAADQQQKLQIDHRNNDNQTALSLAAQFGHSQVCAELLAHRADPNLRNNQLESPLDLACLNGHLNTVRVLLDSSPHLVEDLRKPHSTLSISTYPFSHAQSASHEDNSAQAKRHPSASGWSSLLRGTTMKDLSPTSDRMHKTQRRATMAGKGPTTTSHQNSLDSTVPIVSERLLDHSPLHHAVRRAHLNVVDLLLNYYEANIYQLTSLGSVMHELVMTNHSFREATKSSVAKHYPHSDMIRVFLARLSRMSAGNPNEIRTRWQHLLSARNGQQRSIFDMLNDINDRNAQELQRAILEISEQLGHNLNRQGQQMSHQPVNSMGQQQQQQRQQVFTNSHHLNSFVTMKRAPKQQSSKLTRTRDDESQLGPQQRQQQQAAILSDGTQTIGRSKMSTKNCDRSVDAVAHLDDQAGSTRSISSMAQNNDHQMTHMANTKRPSTINWPALTAQQNQQYAQQHQLMLNQNSQEVRSKRSKSRDLGSILKEVDQNGSSSSEQEQLYDNQLLPSIEQLQQQQRQLTSNHLVRSQTDCSHVLGRYFSQHEYQQHQQSALPSGGRPSAGGEHRLQGADLARHHYKQHNPNAHSSENSSLISGLDQERLVPTSIAQQHSATLDRRAINRHYHVYEHEFYPPRLVTATSQGPGNKSAVSQHASERAKQVVAIVPPLNHNPTRTIDHGSLGFARSAGTQAISNSRLSLNMENIANYNGQLLDANANQHDQMNRFVVRSSRQSTGGHLGRARERGQHNTAMVDTSQGGFNYEHQQTMMLRPQSMHSSQSLESRLGSDSQQALSFENTRRALMRDFDKMIGRELLNTNGGNKYSDHSSDGGHSGHSQRMVNSTSSSSQNSILTGVSLDMDTRGEHLIVSGTRITMPDAPPAATMMMMNQSISSGSMRSSPPSNQASQRVSPRESSAQTTRMSSQHTQTGNDNLSQTSSVDQNRRDPPPQKPPRPSLESQQIYKALRMGGRTMSDLKQQASPVIYDVPSHNNSLSNLADSAPVARRPGSRTSINSSSTQMTMTPPSVGGVPPARPPQPMPRKSGVGNDLAGEHPTQQVSITQPPTVRPPPPPVPSAPVTLSSPLVAGPLEPITATNKRDRLKGPIGPSLKLNLSSSSSGNSPTSSTSSSFKPLPNQRPSATLADRSESEARNVARIAAHIIQAADGGDSGVCTSNSPASTSHDSESGRPHLELSFGSHVRSKPNNRTGSVIMAPPSPRTAQMSIEEAFMPLEETTTQEVANQTNSIECSFGSHHYDLRGDDDDEEDAEGESDSVFELDGETEQATSFELGSQVDEIFGWLGSTNKSLKDQRLVVPASAPRKAGYENCIELQDRLRASRCRSIGDLFRGIASELKESHNPSELSGRSTATSNSSAQLAPARTCSSEEGDYAATSETRGGEHPESSSSGENSSSSLETQPTAESTIQHNSESAMTPRRQCKEIMVRVVVDESQKETNGGDDVFYISPLELKRISSNVDTASESTNTVDAAARRFSEAETLTEEELCASVDKNTGYIRFTLRKRRAASAAVDDSHVDSSPSSLEQRQVSDQNDLLEPVQSTNAKRTKINSDEEEREATNEQLPGPLQTDKCESNETMQQVIEDEERKERVGARKASCDSISMEVPSRASSSSSTSEMSIKSIVSLKVQRPEFGTNDDVQAPNMIDPVNGKQTETVDVNLEEEINSREQTPTSVSVAQPSQPKQVSKEEVDDEAKQVKKVHVTPKFATSLVSETARRLEAAAAAKAANGPLPAAAARRSLKRNSPNEEKLERERVGAKPPAPLPKKSICWPPTKVTDDNDQQVVAPKRTEVSANPEIGVIKTTTSTPTGPVIGRVSANRLSFQRLIEEKSKAANNTLGRLKPPPPVKPAGLIVPQSFKS